MSDAILLLPKGERRIEIRDGALYLGLWSRGDVVHWVKASVDATDDGVVLDKLEGAFVDVVDRSTAGQPQ